MLARVSRYLIITIAIFIAAIYLPDLYWLSFSNPVRTPFVAFSPVSEEFLTGKIEDRKFKWLDSSNNYYSYEQVDSLLPFFNYRQLASKGRMPDSVRGVPVNLDEIRLNNFRQRIRPASIEPPKIILYPLFESNPPRVQLEMPETFFRVTERMEFIDAASNKVVDSLTQTFTTGLLNAGFNFPAKLIAGNPTTRKPFDEGYFIIDNLDQMFHVKMFDGKPVIKNTQKSKELKVREMYISESNLRESYGVLISQDNEIFFILYDNYNLKRLPVAEYNAFNDRLVIRGNLFYRIINVESDNSLKSYVTNRQYELIATHEESWLGKYDRLSGKLVDYIFPFTFNLQSAKSVFIDFYHRSYHLTALFVNAIFVVIFLIITRKRRQHASTRWIDTVLVLITGIYGFLATVFIPGTDS